MNYLTKKTILRLPRESQHIKSQVYNYIIMIPMSMYVMPSNPTIRVSVRVSILVCAYTMPVTINYRHTSNKTKSTHVFN